MSYIERKGIIAEYDRQHKGPPGGARKIMETYPAADVRPVNDLVEMIDEAIKATDNNDTYFVGLKNGLRCAKAFIDGKEPEYEPVVH